MWLRFTFCLIFRHKVSPSISGIMTSLITRSGVLLKMLSSASLPFAAFQGMGNRLPVHGRYSGVYLHRLLPPVLCISFWFVFFRFLLPRFIRNRKDRSRSVEERSFVGFHFFFAQMGASQRHTMIKLHPGCSVRIIFYTDVSVMKFHQ